VFSRALWIVFAFIAGFAALSRADVPMTDDAALKLAFPEADSFEKKLVTFTADERAAISKKLDGQDAPRIFKYWVAKEHGALIGYAVIDDARGKEQPITYLVSVDARLVIRSVEVLTYREARGGEIRQADWRAQFKDKNAASPLRVGADIRNIAGATISCRSLTDGVRKEIECFSVVLKTNSAPLPGTERTKAVEHGGERAERAPGTPNPSIPLGARALVSRTQVLMGTTLTIRA